MQIIQDRELALRIHEAEVMKLSQDSLQGHKGMESVNVQDASGNISQGQQNQENTSQKTVKICEAMEILQAPVKSKVTLSEINDVPEMNEDDREKVDLGDSEEFLDSQESEDNFARQVGVVIPEEDLGSQDEEKRRSKRLRDKEDRNLQEVAMERKEAQFAFINKGQDQVPTFVNDSNIDLVNMASLLGVSLGCALEDIDSNIHLLKNLESARINLFLKEQEGSRSVDGMPDEQILSELYSSEENESDIDDLDGLMKSLKISGSRQKAKRGTLEMVKVTPKLGKNKIGKKKKKK